MAQSATLLHHMRFSTDCPDGTYGMECSGTCGRCQDFTACDKTNGLCPQGCQLWWTADSCDKEIGKDFLYFYSSS